MAGGDDAGGTVVAAGAATTSKRGWFAYLLSLVGLNGDGTSENSRDPTYTVDFENVLVAEVNHLCRFHRVRKLSISSHVAGSSKSMSAIESDDSPKQTQPGLPPATDPPTFSPLADGIPKSDEVKQRKAELSGLALSGGGIRSAAFACGVLESLAREQKLDGFDYLSTVSGGGYAGAALTWGINEAPMLSANSFPNYQVQMPDDPFEPTGKPRYLNLIEHIRQRANYLAPNDDISLMSGLLNTLRMSVASFSIYFIFATLVMAVVFLLYYAGAEASCTTVQGWYDHVPRGGILLEWAASFARPCLTLVSLFLLLVIVCSYLALLLAYLLYYAVTPSFEISHDSRVKSIRRFTTVSTIVLFSLVFVSLPLLLSAAVSIWENTYLYASAAAALASSGGSFSLTYLQHLTERTRALLLRLSAFSLFFVLIMMVFIVAYVIVIDIESHPFTLPLEETNWSAGIFACLAGAAMIVVMGILIQRDLISAQAGRNWAMRFFFAAMLALIYLVTGYLSELPENYRLWIGEVRLVGCLAVAVLVFYLLDPNRISPHRFYRDRLMEAFMPGQSKLGVVHSDETRLSSLFGVDSPKPRTVFRGPYHLVNTNVILVRSQDQKYYQRGGDSFLLSPLYCGSDATGWLATKNHNVSRFRGVPPMTLATAVAISGAAANPNTAPGEDAITRRWSISFIMTLFNIRLGVWQPNPHQAAKPRTKQTAPPNFLTPGVSSLVSGYFSEKRDYIELSDGGHFDNTGLYELFRRRVAVIVLSDASCDPEYALDDLGRALALASAEFGIEVVFDGASPKASREIWDRLDLAGSPPNSYRGKGYPLISDGMRAKLLQDGFISATVHYPPSAMGEPATAGRMLYIKPSLVSDAPVDLLAYALANPDFPHQSTSDQFFTERRFESYRRLGAFIGKKAATMLV